MPSPLTPASLTGGRRHGASVKTLKRMLKAAGLKTTGRKAALTRRAKKAHLKMRGGVEESAASKVDPTVVSEEKQDGMGRRRRHRSRKH